MRILFLSPGHPIHDGKFVHAFRRLGLEVDHFKVGETWDPNSGHKLPEGLAERLMQWRPDLVLAGPLHTAGAMAAMLDIHPLVLMPWASDVLWEARQSKAAAEACRFALRGADGLFFDNPAVLEAIHEWGFSFESGRQFEAPWGIELVQEVVLASGTGLRQSLGWMNRRVILSNRNWEPIYDVLTALGAFAQAELQARDLRMILAGSGSQREAVHRFIAENEIGAKVHLVGCVSNAEMLECCRASDIYLSASLCDGTSLSLLEAMDAGLVPVVSDLPGNRSWIQSEANGWLFPTGNVGQAAQAILHAVSQPESVLEALRCHNRTQLRNRADWNCNSARLVQFLRNMAAGGGSTGERSRQ